MLLRMLSIRSLNFFSSKLWSYLSVFYDSFLNAILMRVKNLRFIWGSFSKFVLLLWISSSIGISLCFFVKIYSQLVLIKIFVMASKQYLCALNRRPLYYFSFWLSWLRAATFLYLLAAGVALADIDKSPVAFDSSSFVFYWATLFLYFVSSVSSLKKSSCGLWSSCLRLDWSTFKM